MVTILLLFLFFNLGCDTSKEPHIIASPTEFELTLIGRSAAQIKDETRAKCQKVIGSEVHFNDNAIFAAIKNIPAHKNLCFDALALDLQENLAGLAHSAQAHKVKSEDLSNYIYDVAVVGAGVAAAVFSSNFLQKYSSAKVIVFDKAANFIASHFATDLYYINSPEAVGPNPPPATVNYFPGAPVQVSDFDLKERFVPARALFNETVIAQFFTSAHIAMGQNIQEIKKVTYKDQNIYEIKSLMPGYIYAKKIVIATGLGVPLTLLSPDLEKKYYEEKMHCLREKCLPRVMTVDDLIIFDRYYKNNNLNIFDELGHKNIAVVGAQDGGMITMEFLSEQGPPQAYKSYQSPAAITWFNQHIGSYNEFINSARIKPRYKVFPKVQNFYKELFNNRKFMTSQGEINYNLDPEKIIIKSFDDMKVSLKTAADVNFSFDYVVVAAGYVNNVKTVLKNLMSAQDLTREIHILCPRVSVNNKTAALKCRLFDQEEEIYIIGTAAEGLPSAQDIANSFTKNSHSINVLNPITETFAREYLNIN